MELELITSGLAKVKLAQTLESVGIKQIKVLRSESDMENGGIELGEGVDNEETAEDFIEEYFPHQTHDMGLTYSKQDRSYWLCPDRKPLDEAIDYLKLTYPEGHPKENQYIKSEEVDTAQYPGPFFSQIATIKDERCRREMKGGELLLNMSDPYDRMLYYGLLYDPDVDPVDQDIDKYVRSTPKFLLYSPEMESKKKVEKANLSIEAASMLHPKTGLKGTRLKLIAKLMSLVGYEEDGENNLDEIRAAAMNEIINKNSMMHRYQNRSIKQWVLFSKCKIEDLKKFDIVNQALDYNRIVKANEEYSWAYSEEVIDDVSNDFELFKYFASPLNEAKFKKIKDEVTTVIDELYGKQK